MKCCFCGVEMKYGNNPHPLESVEKSCCDECNQKKVIPARMAEFRRRND